MKRRVHQSKATSPIRDMHRDALKFGPLSQSQPLLRVPQPTSVHVRDGNTVELTLLDPHLTCCQPPIQDTSVDRRLDLTTAHTGNLGSVTSRNLHGVPIGPRHGTVEQRAWSHFGHRRSRKCRHGAKQTVTTKRLKGDLTSTYVNKASLRRT